MNAQRTTDPEHSQARSGELQFRSLHPATLWVPLLGSLPGLAALGVVGSLFAGTRAIMLGGIWYILLVVAAIHVFRYLSFRYLIGDTELVIRSGFLWRHERRIPWNKIQDIRMRRGVFHRLFDVVKLEITTAGSEEREAALDAMSTAEADLLQRALAKGRGVEFPESEKEGFAEDYVLELKFPHLILGVLTSKIVSTVLAIAGAVLYFQLMLVFADNLLGGLDFDFNDWERWVLPDSGVARLILSALSLDNTLGGALILILGGLIVSFLSFVIRYFRFRLTRVGSLVNRRYGLLSLSSSSLDIGRIQALKVEAQLLRRWFGLATAWADSGGDRSRIEEEKKRDPLVPVAALEDISELISQLFSGLPSPEPTLKKVSPKAVMRGSRIGWLILVLALIPNTLALKWFSLAFLPLFPLVYYLNLQWYRHRGYWIDDQYVISRHGWLTRQTLYLPVKNIQNLTVSQNYFDRRLSLARLVIDTAGQSNTGGGPSISNLPVQEARRIQRGLAKIVSERGQRPSLS